MALEDAERRLDEGNRLLAQGASSAAAEAFRSGLAELPADERGGTIAAHLLNGLGSAERSEGRFDAACAALEQALSIVRSQDPASAATGMVLNNFGYALFSAGDLAGAAPRLYEALTILEAAAPDSPALLECLDNVCGCEIRQGNLAGATATAQQGLRLAVVLDRGEADLAPRLVVLGTLYLELGDPAIAIESLVRALNLYRLIDPRAPEVVQAIQGLARAHEALGEHDEAVRYLEQGVKLIEDS